MRIRYETWEPGADAVEVIRNANAICATYQAQGYDLTLRQLYYQFVARDLLPNNQRSYKRLGDIVNHARLAGLIDWDYIVDRTRNLRSIGHWATPAVLVHQAARQFAQDRWQNQPTRVEVWVEKEALAGVVQQVADRLDVAWFSCRGYVSQSEVWGAAQRLRAYIQAGQRVVILHLGDHDPSGIDMTRDIAERLDTFVCQDWLNDPDVELTGRVLKSDIRRHMNDRLRVPTAGYEGAKYDDGTFEAGAPLEVRRIALNWDQVEQYNPPPNPAKLTDSRATGYIARFGDDSWELDALEPAVLDALIEEHVAELRDDDLWDAATDEQEAHRRVLTAAAARWADVAAFLA